MNVKLCTKCKSEKSTEKFSKRTRNKTDGLSSWCKDCLNDCNNEAYKTNPERRKAIYMAREVTRRKRLEFMAGKKSVPCYDCGVAYPAFCMDFDHVRGEKVKKVSGFATHCKEAMTLEIAKCDIVCANCHRVRTARRGGWKDYAR